MNNSKIEILEGKIALEVATPKDYIDWAEDLLLQGIENEYLLMLVSYGVEKNPDSYEIKEYFEKSLKALNIPLSSPAAALKNYAKQIALQIAHNKISTLDGLDLLEPFYFKSDYEPIYSIWSQLEEDLVSLKCNDDYFYNSGLSNDNVEQYIKNIALQFSQLLECQLPDNFFQLCVCQKCGHIDIAGSQIIEKTWLPDKLFQFIFKRPLQEQAVCNKCGAPFPGNMTDYTYRQIYLDSVNNAPTDHTH